MSYRKIKVGEKEYEYTIGREFIKIKTIGVFPRGDVGKWFADRYGTMHDKTFQITPKDIELLITRHTL